MTRKLKIAREIDDTAHVGVEKLFVRAVMGVLLLAVGCTKSNPNSCCTSADQCTAVGLKGVTDCKSGNVCDPYGACVKPQCSTSADCTSADAPICTGQLCVARCTLDAECASYAGTPYCGADGACIACKDDTQCSADKPVCDPDVHACRGCEADPECTGGICLESAGTCATDADVVYIRADGSDSAACTRGSPCATFSHAFQQLDTQKRIVHVLGGAYSVGDNTVTLPSRTLYIDADDTVIRRETMGPVFTAAGATAIFSHVVFSYLQAQNQALAISSGEVELFECSIPTQLAPTGGTLEVAFSKVDAAGTCMNAGTTLHIHDSALTRGFIVGDCNVTYERNRFDFATNGVVLGGGLGNGVIVIENNLIVSGDYFTDPLNVNGAVGSKVRFNTLVNTGGVDMGATPLSCNANVDATSNIIAWHSSSAPGCATSYSLFDTTVGLQPGTGNKVGDPSTFFVDLDRVNLHLAPNSPAKEGGEPGQDLSTDIEGNPRPDPAATAPDIGAYEAP